MRGLLEPKSLGTTRTGDVSSSSAYQPTSDKNVLEMTLNEILFKSDQIQDPYEAMFFLTSGISYLQIFEDGNKRMGRLLGNLPLKAGLPPMSFLSVDKTQYIQGLIEFYELGESDTLSQALGDGYIQAAHVYRTSTQSQRVPRTIELRRYQEINNDIMKF